MKIEHGYGLVLVLVFLASSVLIGASLSIMLAPSTIKTLGPSQQNGMSAQMLTLAALEALKTDVQTRLNNNQTVDTSYTLSATDITAPTDPANPGSGTTVIGSYSGTITLVRGFTYLANVVVTVGDAVYSKSELFQMNKHPMPGSVFDCSVDGATIETAIAAGTISTISDADLISYAQNGCYARSGSITTIPESCVDRPTTYRWESGTFHDTAGTGIYEVERLQHAIGYFDTGSYSRIELGIDRILGVASDIVTLYSTTTAARAIHIDNNQLDGSLVIDASSSSGAHTFALNSKGGNDLMNITGSTGNDVFSLGGTTPNGTMSGGAGDDTFIFYGTSASSVVTGTGNDKAYLNLISSGSIDASTSTTAQIYFNSMSATGSITGSPGNDTIACNVGFNAATPACSSLTSTAGTPEISTGSGNDTVYLPVALGANFNVVGGAGNNLIYANGLSASSSAIGAGSGKSLVIVGGNIASGASVTSTGTNSVLLINSAASTSGATMTGFSRTLYY